MKPSQEHEAFKQRLVEDVLGDDSHDRVPMEKVVMLMWAFRDDPSIVSFMARFVTKYAGSKHVFDGIEFYLPQLAHMIIHLEVQWDDTILERFALVIAQQSLHFALQLNWILQGALEDYKPELQDGAPNPTYNALFYGRCLKLLKNLERCVVYGKPRAQELQRLYEMGKISKQELVIMEQADRRFNALQIVEQDNHQDSALALDGWLDIQMPNTNEYVSRFCVLEKHVLNTYKMVPKMSCCGSLKLDRAMSLEKATVVPVEESEQHIIEVRGVAQYSFRIRLPCKEEAKLWKRRLQEEAELSALFHSASPREADLKKDLTPAQLDRYIFFQQERLFVADLTDLAEALRFKDRSERKALAPTLVKDLKIPQTVYLPLCNSSDVWRRVSATFPKHTRVFNTKERCPVVMHFLSKRGEVFRGSILDPNLDTAEYMHAFLEVTAEKMESVPEERGDEDGGSGGDEKKKEDTLGVSMHSNTGSASQVWNMEDTANDEPPTPGQRRGNRRVQRLLKDNIRLPAVLSTRLPRKQEKKEDSPLRPQRPIVRVPKEEAQSRPQRQATKRFSIVDQVTELQPMVPILEGQNSLRNVSESDKDEMHTASTGDGTLVAVGHSSIMFKNTILYGDLEEGDIDVECIERAKKYVCGGQIWAEQSAKMLEEASISEEFKDVQLEVISCLSKSNDDLRQEVFIMQMIHYYKSVFAQADLPLYLRTYRILSTSSSTGLLELLTDATSIDGLKKSDGFPKEGGLRKYFEMVYGKPDSKAFKAAQANFMQSLAAYAIVSYLLGLKDRHNGNIMIDTRGHLIFIDFGFALGMAPGHEFSFERAPFKLTKEYVDLMGGVGSPCYQEFERLFVAGFEEARRNSQIALGLVEIMMYRSNYPCFSGSRYGNGKALVRLQEKLMLDVPDKLVKKKALALIRKSRQHFGTYLYDKFQLATNGYAM